MLKLSLIIPVFNEERHIKHCLMAVANQTEMPDEVIVVDNNCTDRTIQIARAFDFVKVIVEKKQGRAHARNAGFNMAKYDVLGRIDADSRVASDWVARVKEHFVNDNQLSGITGLGKTVFFPGVNRVKTTLFCRSYFWIVHAGFRTITMWGANMAIRRSAWEEVRQDVCLDDNEVHEDQDISLWIAANGGKIIQDNNLRITTNGQSYRYLPKSLRYTLLYSRTKRYHRRNGNLSSKKLNRIGFLRALPGKVMSFLPTLYFSAISIIPFPLDYLIQKYGNDPKWLD